MSLVLLVTTFAFLLFLSLALRKSLLSSAAAALSFAGLFHIVLYGFDKVSLTRAALHGLLTAAEISLLVLGALSFFNFLKAGDFLPKLRQSIEQFSSNKLIVTILLTLFFGAFIEGISGFGTPAMIMAPLLLVLRFPPYLAAILPLLANTVPVLFGAVGTPVKIGFADLLLPRLPVYGALLMLLPVILLPFFFRSFLQQEGLLPEKQRKAGAYFPALSAGLFFALPFMLFSFTGPEFPSIFSPIAGLALWLLFLRLASPAYSTIDTKTLGRFFHTFRPYLIMALLLLVGKLLLQHVHTVISWPAIGLEKSVSAFQPGFFFLLGLIFLYLFSSEKKGISLKMIFAQTLAKLPPVVGTITCLTILARLLSQNLNVTEIFGETMAIPSPLFYTGAVTTGILGSFMAGSATVSNLLFGPQWYQISLHYDLPAPLLLACQLAGAAIGNALSLQNIVMVQAVLNEKGLERMVIGKLWKVILVFFVLVCVVAIIAASMMP